MLSERKRPKLLQLATLKEGFAKSLDGTRISFRAIGKEAPPILCVNGLGVSTFFWTYLEQHFRDRHQVVTWDYRGHGHSELKTKNYSIEALVQDLRSVVKALRLKKGIFIGHSLGTQVIFEYYRRYPKEVEAIVSCFGYYGHPMDSFYNLTFSPLIMRLVYFLGTTFPKQSNLISRLLLSNPLSFWVAGILKVANTGMVNRADVDRYARHVTSIDPLLFTNLLKSSQESTAEDLLPRIKVPTLIIAGEEDQFTPAWISKKMHRLIPRSEIITLRKATHAGLVEQADLVNLRIEKFLEERVRRRRRVPGRDAA